MTAPNDNIYPFSEPNRGPSSADETAPVWHMARAGGKQEGPLSLADLQQRVAARLLGPSDLVWKQGMPAWVPAGSRPELFPPQPGQQASPAPHAAAQAAAAPGPQQAAPPPFPGEAARKPAFDLADLLRRADPLLSRPSFYRTVGRVCGALAVLTLLISVLNRSWFTDALLLALVFFVGEAAGAILAALERIEASSAGQRESSGDN